MNDTQPVIEVRNLTRAFRRKTALQDVSLDVPRGCVFGLLGENGAGKSTLIKHILGALRAKQGSVSVFGMDPVKDVEKVLARIGYLSEDREMPNWMRVGELTAYTKAFYPNWDDAFAQELLETFNLDPGAKIKTLSRGERAKTGLLVALAHRPELLVLDEPSSGLDAIVRNDILAAIVRTVADEGRTVFFSSHLLDEVERVSDRIAMISHSRLVLSDSMDNIKQSHYRMTIRFAEALPAPPNIEGALGCQGSGREWTVLCDGQRDLVVKYAAERNAAIVEESIPSLEEIFIAHSRPTKAK